MNRILSSCVTLASLACLNLPAADAQLFRRPGFHHAHHAHHAGCCDVCDMPEAQCSCSQPVPVVTTRTRPVVTTQLRAQQVTTYRDVTETQMRHQQVLENVPVTSYKNVTVDEGGYQMVWVSKPVNKQVAQTTVQQQMKTVAVPFQVTRRVPQLTTQMVPVQTVQHVTEQVVMPSMAMSIPAPMTFSMAATPGCDSCGNTHAFGMPMFAPQLGYLPPTSQFAPYSSFATTQLPPVAINSPQTAFGPTPLSQPQPELPQWQTVPARTAPDVYETVPARAVPRPTDETAPAPRKTSMFSGVPSAAAVWQLRSTSTR